MTENKKNRPLESYDLKSPIGRAMLELDMAKEMRAKGDAKGAAQQELQALGEIFSDVPLGKLNDGQFTAISQNLPDDLREPILQRLGLFQNNPS